MEQQLYYKEITEACVGSDEARKKWAEAPVPWPVTPASIRCCPDSALYSRGSESQCGQHNLAIFIYLMRMV